MQEMDVDGRGARFENRFGHFRIPVDQPQAFGYVIRYVECFFPVRSIPKSLKQSSQSDSIKSNDVVPEGSGSKQRVNEASPDSGIQKSESGVIPSAPVSIYRFPPACRYDSEEMRIQLWGR